MDFSDSPAREQRTDRAKIKSAFRSAGMPADQAEECVDLACHAAFGALDTIFATADRASSAAVKMNVLSMAVTIAEAALALLRHCHTQASQMAGVPLRDVQVQTGGQPNG